MSKCIDLNADLGEGQANDGQLMALISSASIACGGHAGDRHTMRKSLTLAKKEGVVVGAHPGFVDRENFGRVVPDLPPERVCQQIEQQVKTIMQIAAQVDQPVRYIKLHGALYNKVSQDEGFARIIFAHLFKEFPELAIMALDKSVQARIAGAVGFRVILEAFVDRRYTNEGLLVDRKEKDALISTPELALKQALHIVQDRAITTRDGKTIMSSAQSLCLHGDNQAALRLAEEVVQGLNGAGITIQSPLQK